MRFNVLIEASFNPPSWKGLSQSTPKTAVFVAKDTELRWSISIRCRFHNRLRKLQYLSWRILSFADRFQFAVDFTIDSENCSICRGGYWALLIRCKVRLTLRMASIEQTGDELADTNVKEKRYIPVAVYNLSNWIIYTKLYYDFSLYLYSLNIPLIFLTRSAISVLHRG